MLEIADLPHLNAALNALATVVIIAAYVCVRSGRVEAHKLLMKTALALSAAFLTSYLIYHANAPIFKFRGEGIVRPVYYVLLISHVILAMVITPTVLMAAWRGIRGNIAGHRTLVRWVLPVWLYVTVTGVLVYGFLYHWPVDPAAAAATTVLQG